MSRRTGLSPRARLSVRDLAVLKSHVKPALQSGRHAYVCGLFPVSPAEFINYSSRARARAGRSPCAKRHSARPRDSRISAFCRCMWRRRVERRTFLYHPRAEARPRKQFRKKKSIKSGNNFGKRLSGRTHTQRADGGRMKDPQPISYYVSLETLRRLPPALNSVTIEYYIS